MDFIAIFAARYQIYMVLSRVGMALQLASKRKAFLRTRRALGQSPGMADRQKKICNRSRSVL